MKTNTLLRAAFAAIGGTVLLTAPLAGTSAVQSTGNPVRVDNDDIGSAVTSTKGPEAGVWVIAETTDLPTRFAKIVVITVEAERDYIVQCERRHNKARRQRVLSPVSVAVPYMRSCRRWPLEFN